VDDTTLLPEFDALYLDMNGLIHNATHGNEGVSKNLDEKDLMLTMFANIDFMVKTIKPRRLLYMAIDGCAPRAKMNQQRSRRFRAARDLGEARKEAATESRRAAKALRASGLTIRDIGAALGISFQRAHQLVKG
jgi:5'-3' exonuclease